MSDLLSKLDGYKTFLAAGGATLLGLYHLLSGDSVRGMEFLTLALGFLGLRQAIEKATPKE